MPEEKLFDIVDLLVPYQYIYDLKWTVLMRLSVKSNSRSKPLQTVKAALDLLKSAKFESKNAEEMLQLILTSCACIFEEAFMDPLAFIDLAPNKDSDLEDAFLCLVQFWKNNVCRNCRSVDCKDRRDIPTQVVNGPLMKTINSKEKVTEIIQYHCYTNNQWYQTPKKVSIYNCKNTNRVALPAILHAKKTTTNCTCGCLNVDLVIANNFQALLKKSFKK